MKRQLFLLCICTAAVMGLRAQRVNDHDIDDSVIGWWNKNRFDHLKPQIDTVAKKKEVIVNDILKWVKTSYTPVAGLGSWSRYIGSQGYGVVFDIWNVSHDKQWTEPNGNFKPIPEENTSFYLSVNQMLGSWPIAFINTGGEFYFTMEPNGYANNDQTLKARQGGDPRIHSNCYPFVSWINDWCTVYLAPGNKLPWTPVSKGELLDKAEAGLEKVMADKRKEVATQWPDGKKAQDEAIAEFSKTVEKYRNKIHQLKQRYGSTLNQQAVIRDFQPDMYSFEVDPDLFKIDLYGQPLQHAYPVYKLDAATYAKMNSVEPRWVSVAFPFASKESGSKKLELFTAMSQNINYEYIYNYFYAADKIKGKSYAPANEEGMKVRLAAIRSTRNRNETKLAAKQGGLKEGVLLYDDFSQEPAGTRPAGWYFSTFGPGHVVTTVPGENGKWLKLGYNNAISSSTLKTLPEDFSLEFDMLTGAFDGRWGAGIALELRGSNKDKSSSGIKVEIVAGNQGALDAGHDYRGEVRMSLINSPSKMAYNDRGGYYNAPQPAITSSRRKVHVQLLKKGDRIALWLNGKEFCNSTKFKTLYGKDCGDCSIPAGMLYEGLRIKSTTQEAETVGCYIGNIKMGTAG